MTREELKNLIATTGGCIYDVESVLKSISAAGLSVVPMQATGDMICNFIDALDGRRAWVNQVKDGLKEAIKSGDVLT